MEADFYDASKPDSIERLARICGQTNYWVALGGDRYAQDCTEDMAALSFARSRGCVPEVLEAYVGDVRLYWHAIMAAVFEAIVEEFGARRKEWPWMHGAIVDAMRVFTGYGERSLRERARLFKVDKEAYAAMFKLAKGILETERADAVKWWKMVRFGR